MPGFLNMQQNDNQNQNNSNNNDNGTDNNSNNNNQNNNSNDNNNQNNNDSNNVDNNMSIWDNKPNENADEDTNLQNQNQNTDSRTPAEIFNEHVSSLNLSDGIDVTKLQEDLQNGTTESLDKAFEQVAANTYKATLQQVNTLVDNKINSAIEKAVSESTSVMNETTAVKEMQQALPFTTGRDIAPVAEAALKQLMSNGASVQDAVKQVANFFQSTANAVSGNNQNDVTSGGYNPNTNINNNNSSNNNSSNPSDDWMGFLTNSKS